MTYSEIKSRARRYVGADSTSYTDAQIVIDANERLNEVVGAIMRADRRLKFDDFNHTDMNVFFATLVEGQQDYEASGATFLTIHEVAVLRSDGTYKVLNPVVREQANAQELADLEDGDNGVPDWYEYDGNSIFLYPSPKLSDLTAALGLRYHAQRLPSYFVSGDTTKKPGFNPLYGKLLAIGTALDFAADNDMIDKINMLQPQYDNMLVALVDDYIERGLDRETTMGLKRDDFGGVSTVREISSSKFNI